MNNYNILNYIDITEEYFIEQQANMIKEIYIIVIVIEKYKILMKSNIQCVYIAYIKMK